MSAFAIIMKAVLTVKHDVSIFNIVLSWEPPETKKRQYYKSNQFNEAFEAFEKALWDFEEDPDVYGPGVVVSMSIAHNIDTDQDELTVTFTA